jgi:succinate dehydrogenase/fumarate reductase flavoprotein subunit
LALYQGCASVRAPWPQDNACATSSIPGLYAAGELVGGLCYFNYPGGTGLVSGSVFGKIARISAGKQALPD